MPPFAASMVRPRYHQCHGIVSRILPSVLTIYVVKPHGTNRLRAFVVRIPNVPRRDIPTLVHFLRRTLLSSRVSTTMLNVRKHHGSGISLTGDLFANRK